MKNKILGFLMAVSVLSLAACHEQATPANEAEAVAVESAKQEPAPEAPAPSIEAQVEEEKVYVGQFAGGYVKFKYFWTEQKKSDLLTGLTNEAVNLAKNYLVSAFHCQTFNERIEEIKQAKWLAVQGNATLSVLETHCQDNPDYLSTAKLEIKFQGFQGAADQPVLNGSLFVDIHSILGQTDVYTFSKKDLTADGIAFGMNENLTRLTIDGGPVTQECSGVAHFQDEQCKMSSDCKVCDFDVPQDPPTA